MISKATRFWKKIGPLYSIQWFEYCSSKKIQTSWE